MVAVQNGSDLSSYTTQELRAELVRGLGLTAETLVRLAMVWAELERRGEDLSDLKHGLARNLPLIAAGRLAAEAVVAFAGRPTLLRNMEGVPLERQRRLAAGELVQVIDPTDPQKVEEAPLADLPNYLALRVISEGKVQPPTAQRLAIRRRRQVASEPADTERRFQPHYDQPSGTVRVGRMNVRIEDILSALAAAAGPDHPPADIPSEYVTVRVRLTKEEHARFSEQCKRVGLPDWEMARKALRAFGLL